MVYRSLGVTVKISGKQQFIMSFRISATKNDKQKTNPAFAKAGFINIKIFSMLS